ncbi:hypothetical protein ES332_A03G030900v1 [Gossypium tomentosum]|uniref:Uncharacterized protein n=1 Tax=Gossypium tomentosum TaxID=34277 RepID=A0A5D2R1I8_GOSTO|nr:hypothetical protein ES332_A03G030900v1 [Gossypium tomentosum]
MHWDSYPPQNPFSSCSYAGQYRTCPLIGNHKIDDTMQYLREGNELSLPSIPRHLEPIRDDRGGQDKRNMAPYNCFHTYQKPSRTLKDTRKPFANASETTP